ncbi:MAG TPA: hypothetical protein PKI46_00100 [Bacteroidales bacterium]|nr:hypothetical protein [Bacteroidales bacterium]
MKKKKKNIDNGTIENNLYIPLIDFVRENRLNYSKVYQATLKGLIKSIRKGNRIYICKTDIKLKRTVI